MFRVSFAAIALAAGFGVLAAPAIANAAPYKNCSEARSNGDTDIRRAATSTGRGWTATATASAASLSGFARKFVGGQAAHG
jgi:hypothetical protein